MTTKHDTHESSVVLALAELDRLERDRATFGAAKRAAITRARAQAETMADLRGALEAERPRAWSRVREQQVQSRAARARLCAQLSAEAELAHRERLAGQRRELESQRLRLAALESEVQVARPGRRLLEWSMPAAATALVAFLGMFALGEDVAVAGDISAQATFEQLSAPASAPAVYPTVAQLAVAPAPEPAPIVVEAPPEPEPKAKTRKAKTSKAKAPAPKPVTTKKRKPLVLDDFGGNPLG